MHLAKRARVGDTVVFSLRYHARPERGMYFVPRRRVMWTQGEAIETPSWVPTYNAPNDKTTWEILVTADTGVSVLSNGRLVDTAATARRREAHLALVAGAPRVDVHVLDRRREVHHSPRSLARHSRRLLGRVRTP